MPTESPKQYGLMRAAASGNVSGISPSVGKEFIHKTPKSKRSAFSKALMKKRPSKKPTVERKEY